MVDSSQVQQLLGADYTFFVTDEAGAEHDVGSLVNRCISITRHHAWKADRRQASPQPADPELKVALGMIAGIKLAILEVLGRGALEAFEAECATMERFLVESDTERH